jgi:hypothetical protein
MNDPTEPTALSPAQRRTAEELIGEERVRTVRLIDSLMRQWDGIVEASALTINDDEHDPEGAELGVTSGRAGPPTANPSTLMTNQPHLNGSDR